MALGKVILMQMFTAVDLIVGAVGASAGLVALITWIVAYRRYKWEIENGERTTQGRSRP